MKVFTPFKNTKAEKFISKVVLEKKILKLLKIKNQSSFYSPLTNTRAIELMISLRNPKKRRHIRSIYNG